MNKNITANTVSKLAFTGLVISMLSLTGAAQADPMMKDDAMSTHKMDSADSMMQGDHMMKTETRVKAINVYADWCGNCKVLDPKVKALESAYKAKGVEFITLDYTAKNNEDFFAQARAAGVESIVRAAMSARVKTGQFILVDSSGTTEFGRITRDFTPTDIRGAFDSALDAS